MERLTVLFRDLLYYYSSSANSLFPQDITPDTLAKLGLYGMGVLWAATQTNLTVELKRVEWEATNPPLAEAAIIHEGLRLTRLMVIGGVSSFAGVIAGLFGAPQVGFGFIMFGLFVFLIGALGFGLRVVFSDTSRRASARRARAHN